MKVTSAPTPEPPVIDWMRPQLRRVALPSWLGSVSLHGLLAVVIVFLSQLPSCRSDFGGDEGDSFRVVGIRTAPPSSNEDSPEETPADVADAAPITLPDHEVQPVAEQPPVPLQLPDLPESTPLIGAGSRPATQPSEPGDLVKPLLPPGGGNTGSGAPAGGTSLFGIQDVGRKFVYLIDRSGSMDTDHALQAAKMELLASLGRLNETQQFQIIFYNDQYLMLQTRGDRFDLFHGTDAQRLQVREQIRVVDASGGTDHLPPLLAALKLQPDVIFLLTDGAAESSLSNKELKDIRVRNRSGVRIHCIEFGRGMKSPTSAANFLQQLARENGGQYTYRNVSSLR